MAKNKGGLSRPFSLNVSYVAFIPRGVANSGDHVVIYEGEYAKGVY